jgi:Cytotoxic
VRDSFWTFCLTKPIPKPSILDDFEYLGFVFGERRWRNHGGKRLYTWDQLHGEVEVFNGRGDHLGSLDPVSGVMIKSAVKGRRIDV